VCHHAWTLQIIMGLNKSNILDVEKLGPADDIQENIPRRLGKKEKWLGNRNLLKKSNRKLQNGNMSV